VDFHSLKDDNFIRAADEHVFK